MHFCIAAGGTLLSLQGRGFPTSSFQTLAVKLSAATRSNQSLDCFIQTANSTFVDCLVNRTIPPFINAPTPQTFDVQLTSNSEPANCTADGKCQVVLVPPVVLRLKQADRQTLGYTGTLRMAFEDPARLQGEHASCGLPDPKYTQKRTLPHPLCSALTAESISGCRAAFTRWPGTALQILSHSSPHA